MGTTRHAPDERSLIALLNEAFGGWGDEAYFRWKYTDFPLYDPGEHNFTVECDGEVVAARRVFAKRLVVPGDEQIVHVHGGTAVAESHRRQGLYTRLVEESKAYSESAGSPAVLTFNREGKITTETHKRRGWSYRTLPLHLLPLSPGALIDQYAADVVGDPQGVTTVARLVTTCLGKRGVSRSVELAANGDRSPASVARALADIASDVRLGDGDSPSETAAEPTAAVDVEPYQESDLADVRRLFDERLSAYDVAFARGDEEIRHVVGYPQGESVVARTDDGCTGFAAVGFVDRGDLLEARVLDLVADGDATRAALVTAVERIATEDGADVVTLISDRSPGDRWASLETEYVMWDWLTPADGLRELLSDGCWRITAYDVL